MGRVIRAASIAASSVAQEFLWNLTRGHARAYGLIKDRTGRNLKGLGQLSRLLKKDRILHAEGLRWYFDHRIATAYMRMLVGQHNEPETHSLLQFVADRCAEPLTFVDVGANIGEMVIAMGAHRRVARSIGFEPNPVCAEVCRRHAALNNLDKVTIHQHVVSDGTPQLYVIHPDYAVTSGIRPDATGALLSPTIRLDDVLGDVTSPCVLLIDAEGAEFDVMRGGARFIAAQKPLIIFEYHSETRARFTLRDVAQLLGPDYRLFRLRGDGWLDSELSDTWNCAAVPNETELGELVRLRVKSS